MANEDWNTWAQAQNKKPGQHASYYLSQDMPGGGTSSYRDPYYSSTEYYNSPDSPYGEPTADASLMWSSGAPNDLLYSSGGNWNNLTEEALLSSPELLGSFNTNLRTPGAAQSAYTTFNAGLSPETQAAITALSGSSHNIANETPGGQAELDRLLGGLWQPKPVTAPAV